MEKELSENVLWLIDGDDGRYIHKFEVRLYAVGEVATFYDYDVYGAFDYDRAITCRVEPDDLYGEVARNV